MGSFNVSCGISGGSINSGERTGMVLIEPRKFNYVQKWFLGTSDMYIPVAPMIYGTYNDYGKIVDIERTPAVDYIESHYNMPIDTLINCIQVDNPYDNKISSFFCNDDFNFKLYESFNEQTLDALGFVPLYNAPNNLTFWEFEEYSVVKTNEKIYEIHISNTLRSTVVRAGSVLSFFEDFHKLTGRWLETTETKSALFDKVSGLVWMPFIPEVFDAVIEADHMNSTYSYGFDEVIKALPGAFDKIEEEKEKHGFAMPISSYLPDHFYRETVQGMNEDSFKHVMEHTDVWKALFQLEAVMNSANKIYMPIISGDQGGNPWAERAIAEILKERSVKRISEIEEDNYFEED